MCCDFSSTNGFRLHGFLFIAHIEKIRAEASCSQILTTKMLYAEGYSPPAPSLPAIENTTWKENTVHSCYAEHRNRGGGGDWSKLVQRRPKAGTHGRAVSERRGEIRVQHNGNSEEYNPGEQSGTESSAVVSDESAGTPHLAPIWRCTGDYRVQNPARVSTSKGLKSAASERSDWSRRFRDRCLVCSQCVPDRSQLFLPRKDGDLQYGCHPAVCDSASRCPKLFSL